MNLSLEYFVKRHGTILGVPQGVVFFLLFCVVFRLSFGFCTVAFGVISESEITLENYSDGDVVRYPVVLLRGRVVGRENEVVIIENLSSSLPSRIVRTSTCRGRFKALMELTEGVNHLSIASGSARLDISLFYHRSSNKHFVRLILFLDSSGEDNFAVPEEWTNAHRPSLRSEELFHKFQTAALLWQTATAERLYDAGYGRRTFTLETDRRGRVIVWKQRGKKSSEEYFAKSEVERFREIYKEIVSGSAFDKNACYFILTAFSGENEIAGRMYGRVALGVDNVAMFDSATFFSCPDEVGDAPEYFSDPSVVSSQWFRDSAYRNTRWALTSSTLGAGLHELGHAFGLSHSTDPNDFMSRGFDRFNRIFTLVEPPSSLSPGGEFKDDEVVEWTSSTAPKLIRSPWIE